MNLVVNKQLTAGFAFKNLRAGRSGNIVILFCTVQILAVIFGLIFPKQFPYLDTFNIRLMLKAIPPLAIIAFGVNMLMIAGEFDLTVGSTFTFTALVMAKIFNAGTPLVLAVLAALVVGGLIGASNGIIVVRTRVPSFIVTLAMMWFWRGIILLVSSSITESFYPSKFFNSLFTLDLGPMQIQFVWMLAIGAVSWGILERHKLGNFFFGVGGNRNAAAALGVNTGLVKIIAFVIVGVFTALSGVMSTTRINSISPIQGEGLELQAIASCVIGGTALMGGRGTIFGAFLGAALMYSIQDFLLLLGAPGSYLQMFVGVVVLIAAAINEILRKE